MKHRLGAVLLMANVTLALAGTETGTRPKAIRIMPIGDSITRGTYLGTERLPNPLAGGWRQPLQDKLRLAGVKFEFVGELDYWAYGRDGAVDPAFSPRHQGLAGFSNTGIISGGVVPTPPEVLDAKGAKEIRVPGIVEALRRQRPDVILLMSGSNGFDADARGRLIDLIIADFRGELFVATIPPQKPPRAGWKDVAAYNAALPPLVTRLQGQGVHIHPVDIHAALTNADISDDGVHPTAEGMAKMGTTWFAALQKILKPGE